MRAIIILALISIAACQMTSSAVADTYAFNENWLKNLDENKVSVDFSISGTTLKFKLTHPTASHNVVPQVFLKTYDESATATNNYIQAFNPSSSDSNGLTTWTLDIPVATFDNKNQGNSYPCPRSVDINGKDIQTCYGILSFVHNSLITQDKAANFLAAQNSAQVKFPFQVIARYNPETSVLVNTQVKTKIKNLPCANCACADACVQDVSFTLSYELCTAFNDAVAPTACSAVRTDSKYTYSDTAYIHFWTDVKTRKLNHHQVWAYIDQQTGDSQGTQLSNSYVSIINNNIAGEVFVQIPIAGPATLTGRDFHLKFIFKLESLSDGARFLENMNDRVLQTSATPVTYADIQGFNTTPSTTTVNVGQSSDDLTKIYNMCAAILAIAALTCVLALASGVHGLVKKDKYAGVPNTEMVAKNTV